MGGRGEDLADEILALAGTDQLARPGEVAGIEVGFDAVEDAAREGVEGGAISVRGGGRRARFGCGHRCRSDLRADGLSAFGLQLEGLVLRDTCRGREDGSQQVLVGVAAGRERVAVAYTGQLVAVELGEEDRQLAGPGERGRETVESHDAREIDGHAVMLVEPAQHRGELSLAEQRDQTSDRW